MCKMNLIISPYGAYADSIKQCEKESDTLTVKELINELKQHSEDLPVYMELGGKYGHLGLTDIDIRVEN